MEPAKIKVRDLFEIIATSDKVRIFEDGKELIEGYVGLIRFEDPEIVESLLESEIKKFRCTPEIRHKKWKEKGLMPPDHPEELADYSFADLQMTLYYDVHI